MQMWVNGQVLAIAQLGPDFLILAQPIDLPPTDALIAMSIDGHERRWPVWLPDGISTDRLETPIARCKPV